MINGLTNRQWNWLNKIVDDVFWAFRYENDDFDVRKNGVFQMRNRSVIKYICTIEEYSNHMEFLIKYHNVPIVVCYDNDDTDSFLWSIETFGNYAKRNLCPEEVSRILNYLR